MTLKFRKMLIIVFAAAVGLSTTAVAQDNSGATAQNSAQGATPSQSQVPQPDQGGVNWKGVGVGAGTLASNIFYIPAKLVYGVLGGVAGGAGYALTGGNKQVADTIWRSSLGGDYVVTPDMVAGKEPLHFSGPTETSLPPSPQGADATTTTNAAAPPNSNSTPAGAGSAPSSYSPSSMSSPSMSGASKPHPIDNGAGPMGGGAPDHSESHGDSGAVSGNSPSGGFSGSSGSSHKRSLSPDTTIE
jgi:uncharacterized membrane protein YgcG